MVMIKCKYCDWLHVNENNPEMMEDHVNFTHADIISKRIKLEKEDYNKLNQELGLCQK